MAKQHMQQIQKIDTYKNGTNGKLEIADVSGKQSYANAVKKELQTNQESLESVKKSMQLINDSSESVTKELKTKDGVLARVISNSIFFFEALRCSMTKRLPYESHTLCLGMVNQVLIDMVDLANKHKIGITPPTPKFMDQAGNINPTQPSQIQYSNFSNLLQDPSPQAPASGPTPLAQAASLSENETNSHSNQNNENKNQSQVVMEAAVSELSNNTL
jgi:hypothetical protein